MKLTKLLPTVAAVSLTIFIPLVAANAQKTEANQSVTRQTVGVDRNSIDKDKDAANEIQELREQVQQLRAIVETQQQSLARLEQRLDDRARPNAASAEQTAVNLAVPDRGDKATETKPASTQPDKAQKTAPLLAGWNGEHAFLRSADGRFETNIAGYAQLDFHGYQRGNHPPNTFLIRRARLGVEGRLMHDFEFRIQGDFADTTSTLLRDFYIRYHHVDSIQATFGQFRLPYSQEEMRPDDVQDFVERSLVNGLAPSRVPGLQISGSLRKGVFEYQAGAFNGKGLLVNNTVGTPDTAVRLRFTPWKHSDSYWTKGFTFGGAYSMGRNPINGTSVRGQTESRSFTFFAPETVSGPLIRANGELTWTIGPAAFRAEYDQVNEFRNALGANRTNLPGLVAKGYMGQFTYLLTGEQKTESSAVKPRHPFFADEKGNRGFGAWELKVRYSSLQLDDRTAKSNRAQSVYTGVNWYLNNFVRYVLDFGFEHYRNPLLTPRPGDRNFFVILSRVQVGW